MVQLAALAAAAVIVALTSGWYHWDIGPLAVITVFTITSELTSIDTGPTTLIISGSGLGLILAAVLLGGGPAAVVGVLSVAVGWLHSREAAPSFRNNLATFAWYPLIAGLFFLAGAKLLHLAHPAIGYYLLVFVAYVIAMAANFFAVAVYACYVSRQPVAKLFREAFVPLLSAQLFLVLRRWAPSTSPIGSGPPGSSCSD